MKRGLLQREERLEFSENSRVGLACEKCGRMIRSGRYCKPCKDKLANDLGGAYQAPKVTLVKKETSPDGKLTLSLRGPAYLELSGDAAKVYDKLIASGGFLPYHDNTDPETITANLAKISLPTTLGERIRLLR